MNQTKKITILLIAILLGIIILPISYGLNSICTSGSNDREGNWNDLRLYVANYYSQWFGNPNLSDSFSYNDFSHYLSDNKDITAYCSVGCGDYKQFLMNSGSILTVSKLNQLMLHREPFHFIVMTHYMFDNGALDSYRSGTFAYELVKGNFEKSIIIGTCFNNQDNYPLQKKIDYTFKSVKYFLCLCDANRDRSFRDIYKTVSTSSNTFIGCRYLRIIGNLDLTLNDILDLHNHQPSKYNITVTWPNGGEFILNGATVYIEWESTGESVLFCDLYYKDQFKERIGTLGFSGSVGSLMWKVDVPVSNENFGCYYKIKLTAEHNLYYDFSDDYFEIRRNLHIDMDFNADGYINILDLIILNWHFGEQGLPGWIEFDINFDGEINILDLILVAMYI